MCPTPTVQTASKPSTVEVAGIDIYGKDQHAGARNSHCPPPLQDPGILPVIRAVRCLMTKHTTSSPHPYLTLSQGTKAQKQTGEPPTLLAGSLAVENNSNIGNNKIVREQPVTFW